MNKVVRNTVIILLILAGLAVFIYFDFFKKTAVEESENHGTELIVVASSLVGDSSYDPSVSYERYGLISGSEFTNWVHVANDEWKRSLENEDAITFPTSMDVGKYDYIVSYGREIHEMWSDSKYYDNIILSVTFQEEYQGHMAFIYQIEKLPIYPSDFASPVYVMESDKKVYRGSDVMELNEIDTEREGYTLGK